MKLSPRLQSIADFVPKGSVVADIGTDHGYIPVYLVEKDISSKIIASDINKGPLINAKTFIDKKGFSSKIETRLGSGLQVLKPREVDTVIVAGMGGLLITEILEDSSNLTQDIHSFILQPMVASEDLRRYLIANNYKIIAEKLAKEGDKYYEIIYAGRGQESVENDIYYEVGKKLFENKDELLGEFLQFKIGKIEKILKSIEEKGSDNTEDKYKNLTIKYNQLLEAIKTI